MTNEPVYPTPLAANGPAQPHIPPPPLGYSNAPTWAPEAPRGLAKAVVILTALVAVLGLVSALTVPAAIEDMKESLASGSTSSGSVGSNALSMLSFVLMLGSYVALALWMMKIYSNLTARGLKPSAPKSMEWWGWFIPLANFVLPFWAMKSIARKSVSMGALLGWWIAWCIQWLMAPFAIGATLTAIDWETGKLKSPDALDNMVWSSWVSAIAVVIAWVFLQHIVRKVTERHLTD